MEFLTSLSVFEMLSVVAIVLVLFQIVSRRQEAKREKLQADAWAVSPLNPASPNYDAAMAEALAKSIAEQTAKAFPFIKL